MRRAIEKALIFFENGPIALTRMLVGMDGKARSDGEWLAKPILMIFQEDMSTSLLNEG